MTLDTLPALPLLVFEGKTIVITDANGEYVAETNVIETAQALVSLVNSAAAMVDALRPFDKAMEYAMANLGPGKAVAAYKTLALSFLEYTDLLRARAALALIEEKK